jgi:predicted DNA-binding transcriptional regulator AlpA
MSLPSIVDDRLLNKAETARVMNCSVALVHKWVLCGTGPKHVKVGARVMFRESELNRYVAEQTRISTHRKVEPAQAAA